MSVVTAPPGVPDDRIPPVLAAQPSFPREPKSSKHLLMRSTDQNFTELLFA
jgi:hypothetical protein